MKTTLMALSLCAATTLAQAGVIDFNPAGNVCNDQTSGNGSIVACSDYAYIAQSYGDVAGVLDAQYSAPRLTEVSLRWWDANYNNLRGVAWADSNDSDSMARIDLVPLNGNGVTLTHFDIGAYSNTTRSTHIKVSAIGGPVLMFFDGAVGGLPGNMPSSFDGVWSSATGIRLEWADNAYNVGVDNVTYSMAPVPEPEAWAMLLAGLASLGLLARRRTRR
ncbi:PEP-CTERM sorting domain-containing protein [Oxalobacteraceae bacterium]|nr:PEP-CTERM sorting domain-containing protein [Oxalobacteraceae bacterium]